MSAASFVLPSSFSQRRMVLTLCPAHCAALPPGPMEGNNNVKRGL